MAAIAGEIIRASDFNPAAIGGQFAVVKTANEIVNNSITMQNDNHLFFTAVANATYLLDIAVLAGVGGGSSTSDIKFGLSGASNFNMGGIGPSTALGTGVNEGDGAFPVIIGATSGVINFGMTGSILAIRMWVYIPVATAGTVSLQWAQITAVAQDTTVYAGSHMIVRRTA